MKRSKINRGSNINVSKTEVKGKLRMCFGSGYEFEPKLYKTKKKRLRKISKESRRRNTK